MTTAALIKKLKALGYTIHRSKTRVNGYAAYRVTRPNEHYAMPGLFTVNGLWSLFLD